MCASVYVCVIWFMGFCVQCNCDACVCVVLSVYVVCMYLGVGCVCMFECFYFCV